MNKRIIGTITIIALILMMFTTSALAVSTTVTASANFDQTSKAVTISGTATSSQVFIQVIPSPATGTRYEDFIPVNGGSYTVTLATFLGTAFSGNYDVKVKNMSDNSSTSCTFSTEPVVEPPLDPVVRGSNGDSIAIAAQYIAADKKIAITGTASSSQVFMLITPPTGAEAYQSYFNVTNGAYVFDYLIDAEAYKDGTYTIAVKNMTDNKSVTINIVIDKTGPAISAVGVTDNGYTKGSSVTVSATDTNEFTFVAKKYGQDFAWPTDGIFTANGNYVITATDAAGNVSTFSFKIDRVAPSVTIKNASNATVASSSHVTKATIVITDQITYAVSLYKGSTMVPYPSNGIITANGSYKLVARDSLGNTRTVYFTVDTIKPVIKAVGVTNNGYTKGNVTITATDTNTMYYTVKKYGAAMSWPAGGKFTANGNYVVTVKDKAGNASVFSFKIDRVAPSITIKNASGTVVKSGSTIKTKATVSISDQIAYTTTVYKGSTKVSYPSGGVFTAKGSYKLIAKDKLGYSRTVYFTIN